MLNDEQVKTIRKLKEHPLFFKVFTEMNDKYKRTGKYSGKISFKNLTETERLFFASIDIKIMEQDFAEFTIQKFLKKKVFTGVLQNITLEDFWNTYNDKKIITNAEIRESFMQKRQSFFEGFILNYKDTNSGSWLQYALENKKFGYSQLLREYSAGSSPERCELSNMLSHVLNAINKYPKGRLVAIPIFATEVTKDPHYFDYGTTAFSLLAHGFCFLSDAEYPQNAEEFQNLFITFGLVKDLVSNQILVFKISAFVNNNIHKGIEHFSECNEVLSLTLKNINLYDSFAVKNKILYVFENPSVFSAVTDKLNGKDVSLICTGGNIKMSAIAFLDKAVENCDHIYYSGDFDPEGFKIADDLKKRYGNKIIFWRMGTKDYSEAISNVPISDERLRKLDSLKDTDLISVADVMRKEKLAGYQERLIELYLEDLNKTG